MMTATLVAKTDQANVLRAIQLQSPCRSASMSSHREVYTPLCSLLVCRCFGGRHRSRFSSGLSVRQLLLSWVMPASSSRPYLASTLESSRYDRINLSNEYYLSCRTMIEHVVLLADRAPRDNSCKRIVTCNKQYTVRLNDNRCSVTTITHILDRIDTTLFIVTFSPFPPPVRGLGMHSDYYECVVASARNVGNAVAPQLTNHPDLLLSVTALPPLSLHTSTGVPSQPLRGPPVNRTSLCHPHRRLQLVFCVSITSHTVSTFYLPNCQVKKRRQTTFHMQTRIFRSL